MAFKREERAMRTSLVLLAVLLTVGQWAVAQEAVPEAPPPPAPPAPPLLEEPQGDVITLTTGAVLKNVQVYRRTAKAFEIQITEEVSLRILRKLVADVQYDDYEPSRRRAKAPEPEKPHKLVGTKLKPEVYKKLTSPIPPPPLKYKDMDLVTILGELSKRVRVSIVVEESIKTLPREKLIWDLESKPGATLMTLLQEDMRKRFKELVVVYQYDTIMVTTQRRAAEPAS